MKHKTDTADRDVENLEVPSIEVAEPHEDRAEESVPPEPKKWTKKEKVMFSYHLLKLFLSVWMIVDMFFDGLQTHKYYFDSPYWNSNHACFQKPQNLEYYY